MNDDQALSDTHSRLSESDPLTIDNRHAALDKLMRQHNDELVNYIYRWVRSPDDARDIAQEAFLRMFRLGDRNVVSHLRGFLYQTAKNIAADWLRRRIVREAFAEQASHQSSEQDLLTPEHLCLAREEIEAVGRAFELLPARTRMALLLIKEDGLSYEEVGRRLGIKTHSARRLIERALEFLLEAQESLHTRGKR